VQSSHTVDPVATATADVKRSFLWQFQPVSYKMTGFCLEDVPVLSLRVQGTNTHSLSIGTCQKTDRPLTPVQPMQ